MKRRECAKEIRCIADQATLCSRRLEDFNFFGTVHDWLILLLVGLGTAESLGIFYHRYFALRT